MTSFEQQPAPDQPGSHDNPVEQLTRWQEAGGAWQVVGSSVGQVTVALLSCDGGEEMSRFSSADPALLELVRDRQREAE